MPAFEIVKGKAKKTSPKEFANELELHQLIDKNLHEIFGLRYIKDEHVTDKHGRIETLAIDESNRPAVIEYKKTKEKGQLTQANRYMTWIRQNPDSFELLVRKNIKDFDGEIDFANPRILCLAKEYAIDDKCLALALGAELWKYRYYENGTLMILREEEPEQLIRSQAGQSTIKKITKTPQKTKTVEEHLEKASPELTELFKKLDEAIFDISSEIEQYTTQAEIMYKTSVVFAYMSVQTSKNRLKYLFRTIDDKVDDPKGLTKKIPATHNYGKITRFVEVHPSKVGKDYSIEDVIDLLTQAYESTV